MRAFLAFILVCVSFFLYGEEAKPQFFVVLDFDQMIVDDDGKSVDDFIKKELKLSDQRYKKVTQSAERKKGLKYTKEQIWQSLSYEFQFNIPQGFIPRLDEKKFSSIKKNDEMYQLVSELKEKGVKVGIFSNMTQGRAEMVRQKGLFDTFSSVLLSYEIGVEKPNTKAYQALLQKLKASPSQVIFVDNKNENVKGATKMGMKGILFKNELDLRDQLRKLGL